MASEPGNVATLIGFILVTGLLEWQQFGVLAQPQLYPSFKTRPLDEDVSDQSIGTITKPWSPSIPSRLIYIGVNSAVHLTVEAHILPGMKTELAIHYQCNANNSMNSGSLTKVQIDVNTLNSIVQICQNLLPIELKVTHYLKKAHSARVDLQVRQNSEGKMTIDEALTHYVLIKVELFSRSWSLMSNDLYLRSWDPKFITTMAGPLVTTQSRHLMASLSQSLPVQTIFAKLPFIETSMINLLNNAPEFVKSTVSVGAFAVFNSESCDQEPSMSIAFMSKQYMELYKYISTAAVRIDALTGRIHFARYGLSKVAQIVIRHAMNNGPTICKIPMLFCTTFKICSRLENSHMSWKPRFNYMDELSSVNISNHSFLAAPESTDLGLGDCQIEDQINGSINVFTNTPSQIICPIVCSRPDERYEFFQGIKKLMPIGGAEFTQYGAVSVHKSGMLIKFHGWASRADTGYYSCRAGGQSVKFYVNIVALPMFSVPHATKTPLSGRMQEKIYPLEQDGYSVSCTVFYSGMNSVTVTPEFYVAQSRDKAVWTKMSLNQFTDHVKSHGSSCTVKYSSTLYSTKIALTVNKVPMLTKTFDFSHRLVCSASVSSKDIERFGLSNYRVQSGTDILVPPIPTIKDIRTSVSDCCLKPCQDKGCTVEYSFNSYMLHHIQSLGVEVKGSARTSTEWISEAQFDYDSATGNLRVRFDRPFGKFSKAEWAGWATLTPVYSYHDRNNYLGYAKATIIRHTHSRLMGAAKCHVDITCLYSTDFDLTLSNTFNMSLGGNMKDTKKTGKDVDSLLQSIENGAICDARSPGPGLLVLAISIIFHFYY